MDVANTSPDSDAPVVAAEDDYVPVRVDASVTTVLFRDLAARLSS